MGTRLEGKVAVVTGAGGGVGRGIALLLADEGASVVVNDLGCDVYGTSPSHEPADRVVEEIRSRGGNAIANYEDVALMEGGERAVNTALDTYGRLDVLVNSVAIIKDRMIHKMTPDDFDLVVRNNLRGTFCPTKHACALFRQQRSGRIVNMSSDAGLGEIGRSNYAAASEGVIGFTRTVARDMGGYGVTCNAISPMVKTRLFPETADEWTEPGVDDDPDDAAPLAVYLCTGASPNINGYVFGVRRGSIFLYSNPRIERSIHKWGNFSMDEMDALVPNMIGDGL